MISADQALARLRDGNLRFISRRPGGLSFSQHSTHVDMSGGQEPFAVILACSDSRSPTELIFDQGFGDLFVIRVAGNIVAPSVIDSVEFAAAKLHTHLVVVMGHTGCGAIQATIDDLLPDIDPPGRRLDSIVDRIAPAIAELVALPELQSDPARLARTCMRANVRAAADHLRNGSRVLEELIQEGQLRIVGSEYSLETGEVTFFDGV